MANALLVLLGAFMVGAFWWARRWLWSFPAQKPHDYDVTSPSFDIRHSLNGPMDCEGVIYGPLGRMTSRFTADFDCSWDGRAGRMAERFTYDSGATQDREWRMEVSESGRITAKADDVIGSGIGQQAGCSVVMNYKIRLPEDAGGHVLDVTDWMYLLDNGVIMNRSQFRKFGIKVAELVATIRPKDMT